MLQNYKNKYHLFQAFLANLKYNRPSRSMTIIGVTGTDGKTTTSTLLYKILTDAGFKTAVITTIGAYIGEKFYETGFHTTTPSSFAIHKYLKLARQEDCRFAVIETTSHALDQNRTWGIKFEVGVVTNITPEHLDYHKTYEKYVAAKAKLLAQSGVSILNHDDQSFEPLKKIMGDKKFISYSIKNESILPKKMKLMGEYNRQNALAAATAAKILGIDEKIIKSSVSNFEPPAGRQELIHDNAFKVIVDFAHTPNAFEKVLPEVKKMTRGRLIHVFGTAGKRDPYKRPYMGNASSKYSDIIILTTEDPRGENIEIINSQIMAGFQRDVEIFEVPDRKKAIQKALDFAKKGDTILITGKGHERSMNLDGKHEIPWSDKEIIQEIIAKQQK